MTGRNWMGICTATLLALALPCAGSKASTQEREHERDRDHERERRHFEDHDRRAAQDWYKEHRNHLPEGLRERDRLRPEFEARMREGEVLDVELRHRIRPVPRELLVELPPCPRHYRYVIIGGHICLIDDGYHVHDVVHFELNL